MLVRLNTFSAGLVSVVSIGLFACAVPEAEISIVDIDTPTGPISAQPHLSSTDDGRVVLSWLDHEDDLVSLRFATLGESDWQATVTVARGSDWFVNWADFPSVVPIEDELWAAHWLVKREGGTYAYDVAISLSHDEGASWSAPVTPHSDNTRTEHGFVSLFTSESGVGAIWLDGRNMAEDAGHSDGTHSEGGAMTLRSAVITATGVLAKEVEVDGRVCDCCQTDAITGPGGPIIVYRDRSENEIRDIYSARFDTQWQSPQLIASDGWEIAGCPVNGPAVDAIGKDVVVAWFTAADNTAIVRFARSRDGGKSFETPVEIDRDDNVGRVDVVLMPDGSGYVSWLRNANEKTALISLRSVSASGKTGPVQTIGKTGTSRAAGFPQLIRSGDGLVAAWTDTLSESHRIRTVRIAF